MRFTDDEKHKFVSRYHAGARVTTLCAELNMPCSTTYSWIMAILPVSAVAILNDDNEEARRFSQFGRVCLYTMTPLENQRYPKPGNPAVKKVSCGSFCIKSTDINKRKP